MRELTDDERAVVYVLNGCPLCGDDDGLRPGPRGGIMMNMTCGQCDALYNVMAADHRRAYGLLVPPVGQLIAGPAPGAHIASPAALEGMIEAAHMIAAHEDMADPPTRQ